MRIYVYVYFCSPFLWRKPASQTAFSGFFPWHLSHHQVDAELGAGFDAHATWYGMVIEEIDDEPGQDENLQPGPMVQDGSNNCFFFIFVVAGTRLQKTSQKTKKDTADGRMEEGWFQQKSIVSTKIDRKHVFFSGILPLIQMKLDVISVAFQRIV